MWIVAAAAVAAGRHVRCGATGDLPAVFVHELSHARAGDVRWNLLLHLISIELWPHPLVWCVRKAHLAACELVANAVSADALGGVADYCRTLARVALRAQNALTPAGIAMARPSSITRRSASPADSRLSCTAQPPPRGCDRRRGTLGPGRTGRIAVRHRRPAQEAGGSQGERGGQTGCRAAGNASLTTAMRLLVLDPQGKPLNAAEVTATIQSEEKAWKPTRHYRDRPGRRRPNRPAQSL